MRDTITRWTTIPANSQYVYPFDDTRPPSDTTVNGSVAARPTPGVQRNIWNAYRRFVVIKNGDNAVTVSCLILTDNGDTNADWEVDTTVSSAGFVAGALALAANTTVKLDWFPGCEAALEILAGGNNPDDLDVVTTLSYGPQPSA